MGTVASELVIHPAVQIADIGLPVQTTRDTRLISDNDRQIVCIVDPLDRALRSWKPLEIFSAPNESVIAVQNPVSIEEGGRF